jgi:hypothetical protein
MARSRLAVTTLVLAAATLLAGAARAGAITQAQADRVAKRVVAGIRGPVVLFRLPSRLPAGTRVMEAGPGPTTAKGTKVTRRGLQLVGTTRVAQGLLRGRRWLFWADLAPNARFQHPSLLILVDDQTGRVVTRLPMTWWPLVNGRRPAFLASVTAYLSPRFRVVSRGDRAGGKGSKERGRDLPLVAPLLRSPFAITGPPDLSNDCLVVMGDRVDPQFGGDFAVVGQVARSLRLRKRDANDGPGLDRAIEALKKESPPCTDVLIWISAHGYPAIGSNFPHPAGGTIPESRHAQVALASTYVTVRGEVRSRQTLFDSQALRAILRKHADTTFKLVVDACFSGRWTEIQDERNMRFIGTAAQRDQMSFGALSPGAAYNEGSQRNATVTAGGKAVVNDTVNPTLSGGFTNGMARGLAAWSVSEEGRNRTGGDLAKALVEAFNDSRRFNFTNILRWTIPVVVDLSSRPEGVAPPPPPPPGPAALTGSCNLSLFDPTEVTYRCSFSRDTTGFGIEVPGGRQITADLPLSGQTCSIGSIGGGTSNLYQCTLSLPAGQEAQGRLRTAPNPAAGMGCTLYGAEGGGQLQRVGSCTGP